MRTPLVLVVVLLLLAGCGDKAPVLPDIGQPPTPPEPEPQRITIDHILIGVKSKHHPDWSRTEAQARQLAYELLVKLQHGADWTPLKERYSQDRQPGRPAGGPYALANYEVKAAGPPKEFPRDGMVSAFGDVGFALPVGGVWIAEYDPKTCFHGFHIIKRVK